MRPKETRHRCMVCRRTVANTFSFAGHHLCSECEELIANVQVDDPEYAIVVERMRAFWGGVAEAAASRD